MLYLEMFWWLNDGDVEKREKRGNLPTIKLCQQNSYCSTVTVDFGSCNIHANVSCSSHTWCHFLYFFLEFFFFVVFVFTTVTSCCFLLLWQLCYGLLELAPCHSLKYYNDLNKVQRSIKYYRILLSPTVWKLHPPRGILQLPCPTVPFDVHL